LEHRKPQPQADWKDAVLTNNASSVNDFKCVGKYYKLFELPYSRRWEPRVFTNCVHNELDSLNNRWLKDTLPIQYDKIDFDLLDSCIDELVQLLLPNYDCHYTVQQCFAKMTGKMRNRYAKAYNTLLEKGATLAEIARIGIFIKDESLFAKPEEVHKWDKAARMIMGRDPCFTLLLAMFIDPIEDAMGHVPQYASGRDAFQMGELFYEKVFGQLMAKTDISKQDSSKRPEIVFNIETEVHIRLMSLGGLAASLINDYEEIVREKMRSRGNTPHGVKLKWSGTQITGERDTKNNNSMVNWVMSRYLRRFNNLPPDDFIVMGDDGGHRIPENHPPIVDTYAYFGFEFKFEIVHDYHDFDFCSSKFIQYDHGKFVLVQHLEKLLSRLGFTLKHQHNSYLDDYYASLGFMYSTVYRGIPVYEDIGKWMRGCVKGRHFINLQLFRDGSRGLYDAFVADRKVVRSVNRDLVFAELATSFDYTYSDYLQLTEYFAQPLVVPAANCGKSKQISARVKIDDLLVDPRDLVHIYSTVDIGVKDWWRAQS